MGSVFKIFMLHVENDTKIHNVTLNYPDQKKNYLSIYGETVDGHTLTTDRMSFYMIFAILEILYT